MEGEWRRLSIGPRLVFGSGRIMAANRLNDAAETVAATPGSSSKVAPNRCLLVCKLVSITCTLPNGYDRMEAMITLLEVGGGQSQDEVLSVMSDSTE